MNCSYQLFLKRSFFCNKIWPRWYFWENVGGLGRRDVPHQRLQLLGLQILRYGVNRPLRVL